MTWNDMDRTQVFSKDLSKTSLPSGIVNWLAPRQLVNLPLLAELANMISVAWRYQRQTWCDFSPTWGNGATPNPWFYMVLPSEKSEIFWMMIMMIWGLQSWDPTLADVCFEAMVIGVPWLFWVTILLSRLVKVGGLELTCQKHHN